ncbi:hypothetical protein [Aquiflexum lacus]|uniref:hypothetical protein n=1 Tax=Aquiflexum lacus TaxID=2483805 RepID=UPI001895C99E|nr:hypothetical protein [Aquiflexum lacus]
MTKLIPLMVEGKRIVQLSQLTIDQANDLRSWLPANSLQKLRIQGMEINDCISFETYEYWFKTHHVLSRSYETILDF